MRNQKKETVKKVPVATMIIIAALLGFVVSCAGVLIKSRKSQEEYPDVGLSDTPVEMNHVPSEQFSNSYTVGTSGFSFDIGADASKYESCVLFFTDEAAISIDENTMNMDEFITMISQRYSMDSSGNYVAYYSRQGYINGFSALCNLYQYDNNEYSYYSATYRLALDNEDAIYVTAFSDKADYESLIRIACELISTANRVDIPTTTTEPDPAESATKEELLIIDESAENNASEPDNSDKDEVDHTPVTYNSIGEHTLTVREEEHYDVMLVVFQYGNASVTPVECYIESPDGQKTYQPVSMNVLNSGQIFFEVPDPEPGEWKVHYRTNSEYLGYVYIYCYDKAEYEYMQDEDNKPVRGYAEDDENDDWE